MSRFELRARNFVTVYYRGLHPALDVTIAPPEPGSSELVLKVLRGGRGGDVEMYRPWEVLSNGRTAEDLILAWIDPAKRAELDAQRVEVRWFIEPGDPELEMAKRFLGQHPRAAP